MSGGRTLLNACSAASSARKRRPCSTSLSSSSAVDRMISLRALDVGDAGQLHQNLVGRAVPGDDRLGHAQLVDAPLDRLQRLRHRLFAKLGRDVRPHRVGVRPPAPESRLNTVSTSAAACLKACVVLNAFDAEFVGPVTSARCTGRWCALSVSRSRSTVVSVSMRKRIVGLHPHHQMDAALQVEPEIDLLLWRIERPDSQGDHPTDDDESPAHDSSFMTDSPAPRAPGPGNRRSACGTSRRGRCRRPAPASTRPRPG